MKFALIGLMAIFLAACNSTPPARNFSGSWQPLNSFPAQTKEIPLINQHIYRPLAIDVTLKSMLGRWAKEAGLRLRYEYPSDFVLHAPVAKIQQPNLSEALYELNALFADQNVYSDVSGSTLFVRSALVNNISDTEDLSEKVTDPLPILKPLPRFPTMSPISSNSADHSIPTPVAGK